MVQYVEQCIIQYNTEYYTIIDFMEVNTGLC